MEKLHIHGTIQEIFNQVYLGIIKQGKPSVDKDGYCVYRGEDNCKCAVGFLIPDDEYDPEMETFSFSSFLKFDGDQTYKMVRALQIFHDIGEELVRANVDHIKWIEHFKASAKEYAQKNNLEVPEVETN